MKILSPYYITVPYVAPLSGLTCTKFTLNVFIWSGLKANIPITPTYQLTKENITMSTGSTKIDISKLVADFIDFKIDSIPINGVLNAENQVWVKVSTYYNTTNPNDLITQTNILIDLATKGYGYGNEGENTTNSLEILIDYDKEYKIYDSFVVPVMASETTLRPYSVISYPNNEINITGIIDATTNSNNLIKNIWININKDSTEEYIEVNYLGKTITLIKENECRFNPTRIVFQNKEGALSLLTFFKKKTDSMDITSEEYESDKGQPLDGFHQYTNFNIQGRSKFSVSSGFVDESTNEMFKQLLLSERVWLYVSLGILGSINYPVNIESKSIEYKTRANDRLINYVINFKYAYNEINNI